MCTFYILFEYVIIKLVSLAISPNGHKKANRIHYLHDNGSDIFESSALANCSPLATYKCKVFLFHFA